MKVPTYQEIKPYVEKKLINEQAHPEEPAVRIFNYTQTCQFSQAWDDVTRQCRGLIMNIYTGEIIARPFPKFFNYQEHLAKKWPIPNETPIITEKLDGSLGILYQLNGKPWIATRGSFTSEQALWATDWYRKNIQLDAPPDETFLFEIIYPENRIVVNYDFSGLVFLGSIDKQKGWAVPCESTFERTAKRIPATDLDALAKLDEPNSEGFVAYFPKANVRIKIKFPEYVRLHKLVTGISEVAIWEHLRDDKPLDDLLEKVPDEFFQWVRSVSDRITHDFWCIEEEAGLAAMFAANKATRKEQADYITQTRYPGIAFSILDRKDYKQSIWRLVRPKGSMPFKKDIDL